MCRCSGKLSCCFLFPATTLLSPPVPRPYTRFHVAATWFVAGREAWTECACPCGIWASRWKRSKKWRDFRFGQSGPDFGEIIACRLDILRWMSRDNEPVVRQVCRSVVGIDARTVWSRKAWLLVLSNCVIVIYMYVHEVTGDGQVAMRLGTALCCPLLPLLVRERHIGLRMLRNPNVCTCKTAPRMRRTSVNAPEVS